MLELIMLDEVVYLLGDLLAVDEAGMTVPAMLPVVVLILRK